MNEQTGGLAVERSKSQDNTRKKFFICEKCGKKLIERKENGLWHFIFGKDRDKEGNLIGRPPVEIYIYGSIKIRCLRRGCGQWNVLNFLPFNFLSPDFEEKLEIPKK
jgi:hypothetical protein